MRKYLFAITAAATALLTPVSAYAGRCEDLRLACERKGELGERGQGNCRAYREQCGRRGPSCSQLRYYCLHKEELGAQGQGMCRQYRERCR